MSKSDNNIRERSENNNDSTVRIAQIDGNISNISSEHDVTNYETEDEAFSEPITAHFSPSTEVTTVPLDVNLDERSSSMPLCLVLNARSCFQKLYHLREMLQTYGPDFTIVTETWERQNKRLKDELNSQNFKIFSYFRKNRSPGGGCAIIYQENRFSFQDLEIIAEEKIECKWAICAPKQDIFPNQQNVKRIAIGSYYISPRATNKQEVVEHIIETIHTIRARYNNEVHFLISGDFNRVDITDILDCYGALKQVCSTPNRKAATLTIILTDLHTFYHPPTTLPPLKVDSDKTGKDSDHNIVLFAPKTDQKYKIERNKRNVRTRPLPDLQIFKFEKMLADHPWAEIFLNKSVDEQVELFHGWLMENLNHFFPEKVTKFSSLDKHWMSPELKQLHRSIQREFHRHGKSEKHRRLKSKFKKLKKKNLRNFYSDFVTDLKKSNPGKWYKLAKKIGAVGKSDCGDIQVESLSGLSNKECAKKIAEHYSKISNEYMPINLSALPTYLPALPPPQVDEYQVYLRINRLKKTKSTLPLDLPEKLRNECSAHLAAPLTIIMNNCLTQSVYPVLWKQEYVTPAPKISHPQDISDLRKISGTLDFSKTFEGFLKDWIMQDVCDNIDISQYGGQSGIGTEHLLVCYRDRILQLLDTHQDKSAVIATSLDWSSAFDRQDPTLAIIKFIKLGVRASLIPLLVSYLTDRKMRVKFNGEVSEFLTLIGGGPQGTLVGGLEYLAQSNDNADVVPPEDRYKFIDDLSVLQLVLLSGLLVDYNINQHVPSDVGIDQQFLPLASHKTQHSLDYISNWSKENLMKLNQAKCNYMVFSRSKSQFATRLVVDDQSIERVSVSKLLGIWISDDMSWSRNTQEMCKKAYSRLGMLTKLKYVGVPTEDLLDIYILFIRSVTEYCAVVFHSSLTLQQSEKIEKIQKTSLKVILGEMYVSYTAALEMCGLESLSERREKRCLDFSLKSVKHCKNRRLFPLNPSTSQHFVRKKEVFQVNFANTEDYKKSAIPHCQRLLNKHFIGA